MELRASDKLQPPQHPTSFDSCNLHALKALLIGFVNSRNLVLILLELGLQLRRVQRAVAPARLDDLGLLFQGKVLPAQPRPHNLLEKREDLVVRDGAWVGKVVDASLTMLCKNDGGG